MRFSAVFALLPLALATPIPDNRSSRAANHVKDIFNKEADVANSEVADIQRGKSAIKNGKSPKPAEAQLQKDLDKGIALRKTNQGLIKNLGKTGGGGGKGKGNGRRDVQEDEEDDEPAGGDGQVVEVRPTQPEGQHDDEEPPQPRERTIIDKRASSPKKQGGSPKRQGGSPNRQGGNPNRQGGNPNQGAIDGLKAIETKQNGATKTVKGLKGTKADEATLDALQKSFQNGNAKLSSLTGQANETAIQIKIAHELGFMILC
ncbi:hypothetical protein PspLS_07000 [Pyricularia sp. CBS 133598]|nr:hypothetical protein PspLS_07000 [Pyricularia sp. CBS 133598]